MKALVAHEFGPVDGLKVEDRPAPAPGPNEVLIDVAAAAINFPDVLVISGRYQIKPPLPFIPGKELAGTVTAVGPGVNEIKAGDRVMALVEYGAFCQRAVAPAQACFKVPAAIPLTHAAGIGVAYQTAHFALHHRGRLKAGETVMVTAANGSVGLAAMQLAKAAGAKIIGVVNAESKKDIVLENGGDQAVVLEETTDPDEFRKTIWHFTGDRGADLLIEFRGRKDLRDLPADHRVGRPRDRRRLHHRADTGSACELSPGQEHRGPRIAMERLSRPRPRAGLARAAGHFCNVRKRAAEISIDGIISARGLPCGIQCASEPANQRQDYLAGWSGLASWRAQ